MAPTLSCRLKAFFNNDEDVYLREELPPASEALPDDEPIPLSTDRILVFAPVDSEYVLTGRTSIIGSVHLAGLVKIT